MPAFFVYILECTDRREIKSLYTGSTKDLAQRIELHRTGKGARYTRGKKLRLVYYETHLSRSDAMKREIEIKKLSVKEKRGMVAQFTNQQNGGEMSD